MDELNGYIKLESVTRELRKTVVNQAIRKNITKIWLVENEDTHDKGYAIFFKENTVISVYDGDYINCCTVAPIYSDTLSPSFLINGWLDEVASTNPEYLDGHNK